MNLRRGNNNFLVTASLILLLRKTLSTVNIMQKIIKFVAVIFATAETFGDIGRGAQIRTGDPLLPKQVRYRTAPRPVVHKT